MGKSTPEQLKLRGFIDKEDTDMFSNASEEELMEMIHSSKAWERTKAIRLLAALKSDDSFIYLLCQKLLTEKKL